MYARQRIDDLAQQIDALAGLRPLTYPSRIMVGKASARCGGADKYHEASEQTPHGRSPSAVSMAFFAGELDVDLNFVGGFCPELRWPLDSMVAQFECGIVCCTECGAVCADLGRVIDQGATKVMVSPFAKVVPVSVPAVV